MTKLEKPTKKNTQKKEAIQNIVTTVDKLQKAKINYILTIKCNKMDFICTNTELTNILLLNNKNDDDKIKIEYKSDEVLEKSVTFPIGVIRQVDITLDLGIIDTCIPSY